jgi:hypothetical protein
MDPPTLFFSKFDANATAELLLLTWGQVKSKSIKLV